MKKADVGLNKLYSKINHLNSHGYITTRQARQLVAMAGYQNERSKAFDIMRHITENGHLNFTTVRVETIPAIMTISSSLKELVVNKIIKEEEKQNIEQMAWGSKEDLVVALELTKNLFKLHGITSSRLEYCVLP